MVTAKNNLKRSVSYILGHYTLRDGITSTWFESAYSNPRQLTNDEVGLREQMKGLLLPKG
jgi:hypothetical protein